ncbi:MAG TPA: class I SAM-dependent methyltransferase [Candidatus Nanopelagicales bacterium]|nr:class I SAM-dependent methyltransferase [Candidatus Nanopelagicales bacterium]
MASDPEQRYDRAYFDRWYRAPGSRVSTPAVLRRKAALALAVGEYYLGRRVRTVLDVGCGEGDWLLALRALRPAIRYTGVDPSDYVVERYGRSRGIRRGSFSTLESIGLADAYDLVVCSNALLYADGAELDAALRSMAARTRAVAFLELYTADDDLDGDRPDGLRDAAYYRKALRRHGLRSVGSQCYLGPSAHGLASALELAR